MFERLTSDPLVAWTLVFLVLIITRLVQQGSKRRAKVERLEREVAELVDGLVFAVRGVGFAHRGGKATVAALLRKHSRKQRRAG